MYNGWSSPAKLLNDPGNPILYSTNNKIMVVMKRSKEIKEEIGSLKWLIQSVGHITLYSRVNHKRYFFRC